MNSRSDSWASIPRAAAALAVSLLFGCDRQQNQSTTASRNGAPDRPVQRSAAPNPIEPLTGSNIPRSPNLPVYELQISPKELADLERAPYSDRAYPAIFIADGKRYEGARVRYRGAWSRSWPKKPLKVLPGITGWNRLEDRFFSEPILRARFLNRLQELLQTEFTTEKLFPVVDRFESQIAAEAPLDRRMWPGNTQPSTLRQGVGQLKKFIEDRRAFLLSEIARLRRDKTFASTVQ